MPCVFFAGAGGSGLFSRNRVVSDLLVSAAGSGTGDCAVPGGHTCHQHIGRASFRLHPGPCALAERQQLAVAPDSGGNSGRRWRRAHLLSPAQSARQRLSYSARKKKTGLKRGWQGRTRKTGKPQDFSGAGADEPPHLAPGIDRLPP